MRRAAVTAIGLMLVFAPRTRLDLQAAEMPSASHRRYFDRRDPTAFGDRGMNLANPWNWALFVAAPVLLFAMSLVVLP